MHERDCHDRQWSQSHRLCCTVILGCVLGGLAAAEAPKPDTATFKAKIKPFIDQHCIRCHDPKSQKAGVVVSGFAGDMLADDSAEMWQEAIHLIEASEMPPAKEPQPDRATVNTVLDWLRKEVDRVRQVRTQAESQVTLRRLTNLEYKRSLQNLLDTPIDIPAEIGFIEDTRIEGFENTAPALDLTSIHMEQYIAAAEHLVDRILKFPDEAPPKQHWTVFINPKENGKLLHKAPANGHIGLQYTDINKVKKGRIPLPKKQPKLVTGPYDAVVRKIDLRQGGQPYTLQEHTKDGPKEWEAFTDLRIHGMQSGTSKNGYGWLGWRLFAYVEGHYRTRVKVSGYGHETFAERTPFLRAWAEPQHEFLGFFQVPIGTTREFEFVSYYADLETVFANGGARYAGIEFNLATGRTTDLRYAPKNFSSKELKNYKRKGLPYGLAVHEIEIEGPIYKSWPPPLVSRVFIKRQSGEDDASYGKRLLVDLAKRAWRRPLTEAETNYLHGKYQADAANVKQACRKGLIAIFASPHFYCTHHEKPAKPEKRLLSPFELATRLSLFLWQSTPDQELQKAAEDGSLMDQTVLAAQAKRLLADERIHTICDDLPNRWFDLESINNIAVEKSLHKGYTTRLKEAMLAETRLSFREILTKNLSVFEIVDSKWTFLNSYLAQFYNIDGVSGEHMRRVELKPEQQRGGVLAHASIHTLTSNGIRTSPIHRGVFILKHILGTTPPPPAPNVAALEEAEPPRKNATIRELLEVHRDKPECRSCHAKIDPLGFALENYDAIGRWRTHEKQLVDGQLIQTHAVDVAGSLPDGRAFSGLPGLKAMIREDGDRFRRCVVEKLLTYAFDRTPTYIDEPLIKELVASMHQDGDRLQDLMIRIVSSDQFRSY